jgi:hypothetical protein
VVVVQLTLIQLVVKQLMVLQQKHLINMVVYLLQVMVQIG